MNSDFFETPMDYASSLVERVKKAYAIDSHYTDDYNIKRGLRNADGTGVIVGASKIGSVQGYHIEDGERIPNEGHLYYRGIDIQEIVAAHKKNNTFGYEEVAYLLLCGTLPSSEQADLFIRSLSRAKALPNGFFENEVFKTPCRNIMNTLSRCVLALYAYDDNPDDISIENVLRQSIELIARFPTIIAQAYAMKRHYFDGDSLYIHYPKENLSLAQNFLRLARKDKSYTDKEAKLLDALLMLHAEHSGGNNSTFTCRTVTSTGSDTYSAISAAINSLKGPLHGGANSAVMNMIADIKAHVHDINDDDEIGAYIDKMLDGTAGDGSGKLYGIGHAVYTVSDPRAVILKQFINELSQEQGYSDEFIIAEKVERLGSAKLMARKGMSTPVSANLDLYSGIVYSMLGIPEDLYTPLFAMARISGWCAHRLEELITGGKIMRPAYRSAVHRHSYVPIEDR
ncbi:MAG: citrate synthase [Oscillospiraceae bacterium]